MFIPAGMSKMQVYIDGKYYEKENAKVSVFDHGFLYGDGVFEGIRIYSGKIFKLEEHLDRLYKSAKALMLEIPLAPDELKKDVEDAVKRNQKTDGYIRLVVSRGEGDLGVNPFLCKKASIVIIVGDIQLYPEKFYAEGIPVITSSLRRISPDCFDVRIKSLNYLNNALAKIEAARSGCMEAVMLTREGYVAECTGDNIFTVSNGTLYTPCLTDSALEGITRSFVMEIAESAGMTVRETHLTQYDLYTADECFLTGTGAEMIPVTEIDGRVIGNGKPGEWTKKLAKLFHEAVNV
jgi:branched-chain amino acid aminotransferase